MNQLVDLIIFVYGLFVGSFVNVVIDRIPNGESIIWGRSHCDYCQKKLNWYELIPVFSFLWLGRKCRKCKKTLSWQYPVVEILTGFIFISLYSFTQFSIFQFILLLSIFIGMEVVFIIDLKYGIIPDELVLFLVLSSIFYKIIYFPDKLLFSIICGIAYSSFFLLLTILTKGRGMGLGDVKLAFFIGLFLGFPDTVLSFYLAFLTGAAVSIILILTGKKGFGNTIPFGPFMVISVIISYLFHAELWSIAGKYLGI